MNAKETEELGHSVTASLNKVPGCIGAILITLWNDKEDRQSCVSMEVNATLRPILPSLLRDVAITVEKQNLMAGVMTEELNPERTTEVVHEETRRVPKKS